MKNVDRITIKAKIEDKKIAKKIIDNAQFISNVNVFASYYMIKTDLCIIKYYIIKKYIIIDMNPVRFFNNANVGDITSKQLDYYLNTINSFLLYNFGFDTDVRNWTIGTIELKKDIKCKNESTKKAVINSFKKCTQNSLNYKEFDTSIIRKSRSLKVIVYDKAEELKAHDNFEKLDNFQKKLVKNIVRVEVQVNQKTLYKIFKNEVKLSDLVYNDSLCQKIEYEILNKFNFADAVLAKNTLTNKINELNISDKKKNNLLLFVADLNTMPFSQVKKKWSSVYVYLELLRKNSINPYFADDIELLKDIIELNILNKYHTFNNITDTIVKLFNINIDKYNIRQLFNFYFKLPLFLLI